MSRPRKRWLVISNDDPSPWGQIISSWLFDTRAEAREFVYRTNKESYGSVSGPYDLAKIGKVDLDE